jgi:hypothetical protein
MAHVRKALVAGSGFALALAAQFLPEDSPWKPVVTALIGLGTTYGVWKVRNRPAGLAGSKVTTRTR